MKMLKLAVPALCLLAVPALAQNAAKPDTMRVERLDPAPPVQMVGALPAPTIGPPPPFVMGRIAVPSAEMGETAAMPTPEMGDVAVPVVPAAQKER